MWTHVMVCTHKTKLLPILAIFRLQEVLLSIPSISQTERGLIKDVHEKNGKGKCISKISKSTKREML